MTTISPHDDRRHMMAPPSPHDDPAHMMTARVITTIRGSLALLADIPLPGWAKRRSPDASWTSEATSNPYIVVMTLAVIRGAERGHYGVWWSLLLGLLQNTSL